MAKKPNQELVGDAPKQSVKQDEFGLGKIVSALAETLLTKVSIDGYVLGIQGPWGSGKSSLANFVAERIRDQDPHHQIIQFDPWLVGEKNFLLSFFLGQLSKRIDQIERKNLKWWRLDRWILRFTRKTLAGKIRKYGQYVAALGTPMSGVALADPSGVTALTAAGLKGVGWLKKIFDANAPSLEVLKANIGKDLLKLKKRDPRLRFTVIIDDTDRLEPAEAAEVLRLVRKVADFPLLTYVVCFDERALARQVESALKVSNGREYIEKIFQNVISIPPQEPFALRRYLRRLLSETFTQEAEASAVGVGDFDYRQHVVLDLWAGMFVSTPRDAVRINEAVKLGWQYLPIGGDFLDFVWLQLIKLKAHDLYYWTQRYLTNIAAYRDRGRPGEADVAELTKNLVEILQQIGWRDDAVYLSGLGMILPGTESFTFKAKDNDKRRVFDFKTRELAEFEQQKRLGSPSHWRQYFAFDMPSYSLSDEFIESFRRAASQNVPEASRMIFELVERPHEKRGHFVDVLLDRLLDAKRDSFSPKEIQGFLEVFGETMDQIAREAEAISDFGQNEVWRKAVRLLNASAAKNLQAVIGKGKSLNWLARLIRDQADAHGLPKGERADPNRQWLSRPQLDRAISTLLKRFEKTGAGIFSHPAPLDILFCWHQLGNPAAVRSFVQEASRSDSGFLDALNAMRSWSSSSTDGVRHPLRSEYIDLFFDLGAAKLRLERLGKKPAASKTRARARDLLSEWADRNELTSS